MARTPSHSLFVGIYNSVVALNTRDGAELWRRKLGGMTFVNVHWDGEELFASTKGEVFRLDPRNGEVLWENNLKGLGTGAVTLASTRAPSQDGGQRVAADAVRRASNSAAAT